MRSSDTLREQLREAIAREEFERAAALRDELRGVE
jgi:protein-arginine kinase activator protein McsA